eukprot:c23807_g1_i3 orf=265-1305(-)
MDYPKLEADAETGTNLRTKLLPEQTWKEKENQSSWRACCIKYKKHLANGAILLTFCLILVGLFVRNYEAFLDSISHVAQQDKKTEILNLSLEEEPTGGFNVLVIGDWGRHGLYNQSAVAQQMTRVAKEMEVEFIISVGDNFYPSGLTRVDDPAFNQSFSQVYDIQSLPKTWHSADGSYVEFFFYDTNPFVEDYWNNTKHTYDWRGVEPKDDYLKKQKEFLSNGLAVSNATWKVVVGHHPIRSVGVHGDTLELQDQIYPILKEHDVDLYVNGHDHCLEHITECGIHFVTSGGGSKAWRGMDSSADQTGLQFYYDGQGFVSISFNSSILSFAFYDSIGNTLHNVYLSK